MFAEVDIDKVTSMLYFIFETLSTCYIYLILENLFH